MACAICCLKGGWTTAAGEAMVRSTQCLVRTVAITERPGRKLLAKFASSKAIFTGILWATFVKLSDQDRPVNHEKAVSRQDGFSL